MPLNDSTFSANSIVSTVNVTQNIKSAKVAEGVTEITINRVYETAVKNSTCIVKSSKVIGTKYSPVALESSSSSSQAQEYFEDRLSEHEEFEEGETDDIIDDHSDVTDRSVHSAPRFAQPMPQYEQFETVESLEREQFTEQKASSHIVSRPRTMTTRVLQSQPVVSEYYGQTETFQPEMVSELYSQLSTVSQSVTSDPISSRFGPLSMSSALSGEDKGELLNTQSFSSGQWQGSVSSSSSTIVSSSYSSSVSSFVTSTYVTSSVASVSTVSSQSTFPAPLTSIPSLQKQQHLPTAVSSPQTVSVIQTDDRVAKDSISINFTEDCYTNLRTQEAYSIGESIQQGLLDFKVQQSDGSEILLSECVQEDGLICLPSLSEAVTFRDLVTAGLLTAANCTLKFAGRDVPLERSLPCEAFLQSEETPQLERSQSEWSASSSPHRASSISSSSHVEPNFPSVLTISSEEVSRETAQLSLIGNFAGAIATEVRHYFLF